MNSRLRLWIAIIGATFCWGIWGVFDKKTINLSGVIEVFFCKSLWGTMFSAILIVLIVYFVRIKFSDDRNPENEEFTSLFFNPDSEKSLKGFFKPLFTKKLWIPALLSAFCLYAGGLTYLLALAQATASYVVVVTGCYPLIMHLLALLLYKEEI